MESGPSCFLDHVVTNKLEFLLVCCHFLFYKRTHCNRSRRSRRRKDKSGYYCNVSHLGDCCLNIADYLKLTLYLVIYMIFYSFICYVASAICINYSRL